MFVIICILFLSFYFFLGKINVLKKNHTQITYLIKGTVLGRALWGANTFPTRNRLPDSKSVFANLSYLVFLVFHSFPLINYGSDSSVLNKNKENYFVRRPRHDPGCDKLQTENHAFIHHLSTNPKRIKKMQQKYIQTFTMHSKIPMQNIAFST